MDMEVDTIITFHIQDDRHPAVQPEHIHIHPLLVVTANGLHTFCLFTPIAFRSHVGAMLGGAGLLQSASSNRVITITGMVIMGSSVNDGNIMVSLVVISSISGRS